MSTTPEVVSTPVEKKEKKERKKERKPAEPEPEIYIPLEDREKALEEIQHLFDPSVKKKSRKRSTAGDNALGIDNGGKSTKRIDDH